MLPRSSPAAATPSSGASAGGSHVTPKEQMLIKKAIVENTNTDSPSADATSSLMKYLKNPQTVDPTYLMIAERVQQEKAQQEAVLQRSIKLLKTYLPKHPPSADVLTKLDQFCSTVNTTNETTTKSVLYIRALIIKSLGTSKPTMETPRVAKPTEHSGSASDKSSDLRKTSAGSAGSSIGSELTSSSHSNFLSNRTAGKHLSGSRKGQSTLLGCLLFGGQFKKSTESSPPPSQPNLQTETLVLENVPQIRERVVTVAQEKKKEEFKLVKESGQFTMRRKGPQLFQYKYYKEQVPLSLQPDEMEQVVNTVVNPPPGDHETHLIASKILIKLLIDIYCGDERVASNLIMSILLEMLASPAEDIKVHAFNLLFNLSVHMNLLDETSLLGESTDMNNNGRTQIEQIQEELLSVCLQLLVWLIHKSEEDERVWSAGFNCLLYFITQDGKISDKKLSLLDYRLVPMFMKQQGRAKDALQRRLIRILLKRLYADNGSLNIAMLKRMGSLNFIIEQYTECRSVEACDNLFLVIYDYVIASLAAEKKIETSSDQVQVLLEMLRRFEAPQFFASVFKFVPEKMVETVVRYLFLEQSRRDSFISDLATRLDKNFALTVLLELEQQAQAHLQLKPEFEPRLQSMLVDAQAGDHMKVLTELLHSNLEAARTQGENWLFALLRAQSEGRKIPNFAAVEQLCNSLANSPSHILRHIYLSITDKLILMHKCKIQTFGDEYRLSAIFKILNDNLSRMTKEKNENNLMYMFDIIFNLVSYRTEYVGFGLGPEDEAAREAPDSNYELFLRGKAAISVPLLLEVAVAPLHTLFIQLPPNTHFSNYNNVRTTLLLMLIEKCKQQQDALEIVGMSFFRQLLGDRNPAVAFHASRFLIDELQAERPEQYTAILNTLLSKAQQTNDEQLLSNPYLQIHEMIRGFAQTEDDKKGAALGRERDGRK